MIRGSHIILLNYEEAPLLKVIPNCPSTTRLGAFRAKEAEATIGGVREAWINIVRLHTVLQVSKAVLDSAFFDPRPDGL